jgi:hypothetical protein
MGQQQICLCNWCQLRHCNNHQLAQHCIQSVTKCLGSHSGAHGCCHNSSCWCQLCWLIHGW